MKNKIRKAVIPCAGLGTRFLPVTKSLPKEMVTVYDKPAIQYIVEESIEAGINEILIVTSRGKESIEDYFDRSLELEHKLREKNKLDLLKEVERVSNLADVFFVRQKEPLGLGHAVLCAKSFVGNEPFAVFLPDDLIYARDPVILQLVDVYEKYQKGVLAVETVSEEAVSSYGIIKPKKMSDSLFEVEDVVEKPKKEDAPSNLGIVGRYILPPQIFPALEKTKKGALGEIQLTDAIRSLSRDAHFLAWKFKGKRYDVGNKLGYIQTSVEYALRDNDIASDFRRYLKKLLSQ